MSAHDFHPAGRRRARSADGSGLAEGFAWRLRDPKQGLGAALELLTSELGLAGACVLEASVLEATPGSDAVVLATAGTIGAFPRSRRPSDRIAAEIRTFHFDFDPPASMAVSGGVAEAPGHALLVWGDFDGRRGSSELLGVLLRLVERVLGEGGSRARPASTAPPELVFPEGYQRLGSPRMRALYRHLRALVRGDPPVLIVGETGVGKGRLARILHASSERSAGPFVAVNCAAIPAELLEAEMFGIGKRVATGVDRRPGKFQLAEGGTLFLDEIGEMASELQAKLLRALQEKEVQPVGGFPIPIDVRVLAATNADLGERMDAGRFRRDLYYRLAGDVLEVPPLRQCREDVPALVGHFLDRIAGETGIRARGVTVETLHLLTDYAWPGNVRQLEHEVRRLVRRCGDGRAIDSSALSGEVLRGDAAPRPPIPLDPLELEPRVRELEIQLTREAMRRTGGNLTRAAELLGLSRYGLSKKLKRLGSAGNQVDDAANEVDGAAAADR